MKWAENHIKLAHARGNIKRHNQLNTSNPIPDTEENLMREYIKAGGRIVHPHTGDIIDNNYGAERDEKGNVITRHLEALDFLIPELVKGYKQVSVPAGSPVVSTEAPKEKKTRKA